MQQIDVIWENFNYNGKLSFKRLILNKAYVNMRYE